CPLVADDTMMFFPCPIEQRHHAMIEQVQKVSESIIFYPDPLHQELSIVARQHPLRASQPHEGHCHFIGTILPLLSNFLNLAWGKSDGQQRTETQHLT